MSWPLEGKKVYVVDMSGKPDKGAFQNISELPSDVDCAVIGLTKTKPSEAIEDLEEKGIKNAGYTGGLKLQKQKRDAMNLKYNILHANVP
jgi:hypothetical protein